MAAAPVLAGIDGAVCFGAEPESGDMNDAAATVIGTATREFYKTLEDSGVKLDRERFMAGVVAVFFGDTVGGYSQQSADAALRRVTAPVSQRGTVIADADEEAENAWVEEKRSLPRAEVLEGGVVLQRLTEGSGDFPAAGSTVKVMYTGRLSNGTVFDETEEPFDLPLDRIIPGLAKAVEQMRFGGTYRVFIPPAMGYGKEAVMDLIPGNSALEFSIELIENSIQNTKYRIQN